MEYRYDRESDSFRPTETGRSRQSGQNGGNDWFGWGLIAFLFLVGAWPIGLILLISKLSDTKSRPAQRTSGSSTAQQRSAGATKVAKAAKSVTKTPRESDKTSRVLRIVGVVLMAIFGLAILSTVGEGFAYGWYKYMLEDLFPMFGFFAGGVVTFAAGLKMKRRKNRIARYLAVLGERDYVSLGELMAVVGKKHKTVERDVEHMIDKGMFGTGAFIDSSRGILFRSADAYQRYLGERTKKENITPKEANEGYAGALRAIRAANDRIPDPVFSEKLDHMEMLAGKIFREVELHPEKQKQAASFFNYYLPTTLKLLGTYTEFEDAGIEGENLRQAKERIESIMDNLLENFEKQLDELYRSEAMDVDSDIRVMESMLARDLSSVERDFGLSGTAAVQQPEEME